MFIFKFHLIFNQKAKFMKLKKCRYCKNEVSPRAKSCPNCGEPNPGNGGLEFLEGMARLLFILMMFCFLVVYVFGGMPVEIKPNFYLFILLATGFLIKVLAKN